MVCRLRRWTDALGSSRSSPCGLMPRALDRLASSETLPSV